MRPCKNCTGPVAHEGPLVYCSERCWQEAAARRRPIAAARSRARRRALACRIAQSVRNP